MTVEFALIFTLVLLPILTAIISYGYMLSFRQSISQAAAEGARAAAVAPASADREAVAESAVGDTLGLVCDSPTGYLTCTVTTPAGCDCISVEVEYAYLDDPSKLRFPGFGILMPETLSYTAFSEISP